MDIPETAIPIVSSNRHGEPLGRSIAFDRVHWMISHLLHLNRGIHWTSNKTKHNQETASTAECHIRNNRIRNDHGNKTMQSFVRHACTGGVITMQFQSREAHMHLARCTFLRRGLFTDCRLSPGGQTCLQSWLDCQVHALKEHILAPKAAICPDARLSTR
jgi:hypothetical protein